MSLRARIFVPLLCLMMLLPLVIYPVFAQLMQHFATDLSTDAIESTISSVSTIVDEIYAARGDEETTPALTAIQRREQARDFLYETRRAIRHNQFDSKILVLNRNYDLLFPQESDEETQSIIERFSQSAVTPELGVSRSDFERFSIGDQAYLGCVLRLSDPDNVRTNYLIVFSSINDTSSLLRASSALVLLLTAIVSVLALAVLWKVMSSISRPIEGLVKHVTRIGEGQFEQMATDSRVHEIGQLIEATNRMSMQLGRYDQAQNTFLQNASHELRTPLMSIQGYAEGIEMGVWEDTAQAAGVIVSESKRLTGIVDGLLTLSRLDNGRQQMELEKIDLIALLKNTLEGLKGMALGCGVELTLETAISRAVIEADGQLLMRAMINVLSNAIRYAKHCVLVSVTMEGTQVCVTVKDDGPGIAPEDLQRVFDRFYKGNGGHNGIGLSIAQSSLSYMGGSIRALSCEAGALFEMRFKRT